MRVALLSDIHGNLLALDAVLADMTRRGPYDQVAVAGDLVWAGPWPAEVVDRIRGLDATVVQGNTDAFLARQPAETPAGKRDDRFAEQLAWVTAQLGAERTAYLTNLPFSTRISPGPGRDLLVVHANPVDLERAILPNMSDAGLDELLLLAGPAADWVALAFGHLHAPFRRMWRGRLLADIASAGLPMDRDRRAVYAIMTWTAAAWGVEHHRVAYDADATAKRMRKSGMPRGKHFAERLLAANYEQ
jgi:predicted phosphodiesterase